MECTDSIPRGYWASDLLLGRYTMDNVEVEYVILAYNSSYYLFDLGR